MSARLHLSVDFLQEVEVNPAGTLLAHNLRAAACEERVLKLDSLVAADVDILRPEAREKLVVETCHKFNAPRIYRIQRRGRRPDGSAPALHLGAAEGMVGERVVFRVPEPLLHVSERVLVGDKLDSPRMAVVVESTHLVRRHGTRFAPDSLMPLVGERMLRIELELVVAERRHDVHDPVQRLHRRHFAPRNIELVAKNRARWTSGFSERRCDDGAGENG